MILELNSATMMRGKMFNDMTLYDYNVNKDQVFEGNPNHLIVDASAIGLPYGYFPNWIGASDIGNGNPFYSHKIVREIVGGIDGELEDILYGDVECYIYKQNGGSEVMIVNNDSYNYTEYVDQYYAERNS